MWMARRCGIRTPLPGTELFLDIAGPNSRAIRLMGDDLGAAKTPYRISGGATSDAVVH